MEITKHVIQKVPALLFNVIYSMVDFITNLYESECKLSKLSNVKLDKTIRNKIRIPIKPIRTVDITELDYIKTHNEHELQLLSMFHKYREFHKHAPLLYEENDLSFICSLFENSIRSISFFMMVFESNSLIYLLTFDT